MQLLEANKAINVRPNTCKVTLLPDTSRELYTAIVERNKDVEAAIAFWAKAMMNSTIIQRDEDNFFRSVDPSIPPWEKGNIIWNW